MSSPVNTLVCGFPDSYTGVITNLIQSGRISVPVWFGGGEYETLDKNNLIWGHCPEFRYDTPEYNYTYDIPLTLYDAVLQSGFHDFTRDMSRTDAWTGSSSIYPDIMYLFRSMACFFYDSIIKNNIELIIMPPPHCVHDTLIGHIARAMGIKIMVLVKTYYLSPSRFFILEDMKDFGLPSVCPKVSDGNTVDLWQFGFSHTALLKQKKSVLSDVNGLGKFWYLHYGYNMIRHLEWKKKLQKLSCRSFDLNSNFLYYPLHYQPESGIQSYCDPVWENQILLIESISKIVPDNFYLVVKENPPQTFHYRGNLFWEMLRRLDNVVFVPSDDPSEKYYTNAKAVVSVAGTVGWEALRVGKPVIYSGYAPYRAMPGAYEYRDDLDIQQIISTPVDPNDVFRAAADLMSRAYVVEMCEDDPEQMTPQGVTMMSDAFHDYFQRWEACSPEYRENASARIEDWKKISARKERLRPISWKRYLPQPEIRRGKKWTVFEKIKMVLRIIPHRILILLRP